MIVVSLLIPAGEEGLASGSRDGAGDSERIIGEGSGETDLPNAGEGERPLDGIGWCE